MIKNTLALTKFKIKSVGEKLKINKNKTKHFFIFPIPKCAVTN